MPRSHRQVLSATGLATALMVSLVGCAAFGTQAETCVDWVTYASPADAMADAELVARTTGPIAPSGTTTLFGTTVNVHSIDITEVLKGTGVAAGQALEVVSTPVTCTAGSIYPDGDPLDASGPQIVFLHRDADTGAWRTITPYQGVVPAPDDRTVPDSWPVG